MKTPSFATGLEQWLARRPRGGSRARIGVVAHAASVHAGGAHAVDVLHARWGRRLTAIFSPEHGFAGTAAAGADVPHGVHPAYGIPVYSLHGDTRKPTAEMLAGVDVLVFDLQDIGARCYTYGSTLRLVLEAAAESGRKVVVADRPVPLYGVCDGPVLRPGFESFVGMIPQAPLLHGLTPGELARWLVRTLGLKTELEVSAMSGWPAAGPFGKNATMQGLTPMGWIPPSPAIRSPAGACCYTATVFTEALPALDCDRYGPDAFQVLGAPWLNPEAVCEAAGRLQGASASPCDYVSRGVKMKGVRISVRNAALFRPVTIGAKLLRAMANVHGVKKIWNATGTRAAFFDQLAGGPEWREAIRGTDDQWLRELGVMRREAAAFRRRAEPLRLY